MSDEVLDDVMIKGSCKGKADAIVNCQCNIESAPVRCEQAERCMFYSYYKCSKQWKRLAQLKLKIKSSGLTMKSAWSFFAYIKKKIFYTRKTYDNIYNIVTRYRINAHEESFGTE